MKERELLKQLVDALDKELPHNMKHIGAGHRFNARVALTQPEQKPVGEVYGWHGVGVGQPLCRFNVTESDMPVGSLLYTTPPQRKPLTDEEIAHATAPVFMSGNPTLTGIARAIEAAHGIKGHA